MLDRPSLDIVNRALARTLPGCAAQAVDVLGQFDAHSAAVVRLGITPSPGNSHPLPSTAIAKHCTGSIVLSEGLPEIASYERILRHAEPPIAPRLLGAYADPGAAISLLLTEDLEPDHLRPMFPVPDHMLRGIVDATARFHATWWEHDELDAPRFADRHDKPTRMPQMHPAAVVHANSATITGEIDHFLERFRNDLTGRDVSLLLRMREHWPRLVTARARSARMVTLIHGDLHLLGNVFIGRDSSALRFIDWAECKPGLGPHDVAYCLISAETVDRRRRDTLLLQRYHRHLVTLGVRGYSWDQCVWDYQFALLTNLLQCVLQGSLPWLRRTVAIIDAWRCDDLLTAREPGIAT